MFKYTLKTFRRHKAKQDTGLQSLVFKNETHSIKTVTPNLQIEPREIGITKKRKAGQDKTITRQDDHKRRRRYIYIHTHKDNQDRNKSMQKRQDKRQYPIPKQLIVVISCTSVLHPAAKICIANCNAKLRMIYEQTMTTV
jgi:hypothetical protein